jgi:hypothetical protein
MQLVGANPQPHKNPLAPVSGERERVRGFDPEQPEQTVLRMKLVGANPNPQVVGLDELPGKVNYFLGNDPKNWHINIPTYARVQYKDIYPGIDLVYYGNQRQLEYDFVVAPGANPKAIKLAFAGIVGAGLKPASAIDTNGDLILHTEGGDIRLHKPRIYQEINGVRHAIPSGYVLLPRPLGEGRGEGNYQVGFQVAAHNTSKPLIIDPTLSYSTYLGGSGDDGAYGIRGEDLSCCRFPPRAWRRLSSPAPATFCIWKNQKKSTGGLSNS